jgi:hypothetical protein
MVGNTSLILSTDSELFRSLKKLDPAKSPPAAR